MQLGWSSVRAAVRTLLYSIYAFTVYLMVCWDSSVGIATRYGLAGSGIESWRGREIFRARTERPWGPLSRLSNGYLRR